MIPSNIYQVSYSLHHIARILTSKLTDLPVSNIKHKLHEIIFFTTVYNVNPKNSHRFFLHSFLQTSCSKSIDPRVGTCLNFKFQ